MATNISLSEWEFNPNISKYDSNYDANNQFTEGEAFTLRGAFGTRAGYSDHLSATSVYSQSPGTNFGVVGRWDGSNFIGASNRFYLANEGINGGACIKSVQISALVNPARPPNNCLLFSADEPVPFGSKWLSSWWVWHSAPDSVVGGAWKYSRWMKVNNSLSDKANEAYQNAHSGESDAKVQYRDSAGLPGFIEYMGGDVAKMPHQKGRWFQFTSLFTFPSSPAAGDDFKHEIWICDAFGTGNTYYKLVTDEQATNHVNPYDAVGTSEWRYHLYQNYFGTGGASETNDFINVEHTLKMDGVYESIGSDWTVEFCDNANYSLATKKYIQPISTWSGDIVIPKVLRYGLTSGYLHVIKNRVSVYSEPR